MVKQPVNLGQIVQQARKKRGWTQARLAETLGISRQSLVAIENHQTTPHLQLAVRLAEVLEVSLDLLTGEYRSRDGEAFEWWDDSPGETPTPVIWSRIDGRLIVVPWFQVTGPRHIDGWWDNEQGLVPSAEARAPEEVILAGGCDPFGLWFKSAVETRHPHLFLEVLAVSSQKAIQALKHRKLHLAGSHLFDPDTRRYNNLDALVPFPLAYLPYLTWQEGLILHPLARNPKEWAVREPGSEAHSLWRRHYHPSLLAASPRTFTHHEGLVEYVSRHPEAQGVSLGSLAAYRGLRFEPWAEEIYEWVLHRKDLESPWFIPVYETLQHSPLKSHLARVAHQGPAPHWGSIR